jgi:hypothetical protein
MLAGSGSAKWLKVYEEHEKLVYALKIGTKRNITMSLIQKAVVGAVERPTHEDLERQVRFLEMRLRIVAESLAHPAKK